MTGQYGLYETLYVEQKRQVRWGSKEVLLGLMSGSQNRSRPTRGPNDFVLLHEAARHAIHSFETLSVSVETVSALQQQILNLSNKKAARSAGATEASQRIRGHVESQARMLQNLLLRSQSNKERLQNEIALVRSRCIL